MKYNKIINIFIVQVIENIPKMPKRSKKKIACFVLVSCFEKPRIENTKIKNIEHHGFNIGQLVTKLNKCK